MFVKISHSLTGSLIIFDCTLLAGLSVHIYVPLVWQMRPIVDFLFLHVTRVQDNTVGIENEWKGKKERSDRLEQTISAWSKLLSGREHCVQWLERGGGTVVKHITSTQSFSDSALHGKRGGRWCSSNPLIITTILMSSNGFAACISTHVVTL